VTLARWALASLALAALGVVHAHAFLVLGEMTVTPDPPVPGAPLLIAIQMNDPSLAPVEDAVVFLELRRQRLVDPALPASSTEAPELPPPDARVDLVETTPGRYEGTLDAPDGGTHHVLIRDQTFQWEEANASVMIDLDGGALGTMPFILPPTAVGPRSLWVWLLWLIGVPLLAGLVVTALVLGSRPKAAPGGAPGAA
jgi:hypothetical protein